MSAEHIAQTLGRIESDIPRDLLVYRTVDWWPLVKLDLYMRLCTKEFGSSISAPGMSTGKMQAVLRSVGPMLGGVLAAMRNPPHRSTGDIWLVSDGVSYQRVGAKLVERFCWPIASEAAATGYRTIVADVGRRDARDLAMPTVLIGHEVHAARLLGGAIAAARCDRSLLTAFAGLGHVLETHGVDRHMLSPIGLLAQIAAVRLFAWRLEQRWRRTMPAAVIKVGYYDLPGFACMLAASRLGIRSADIQHGVAGEPHLAYGGWRKVPPQGYALLPSHFLTWSKADAAVIDAWAQPAGAPHRAIVSGVPMIQAWRRGRLPERVNALREIEARRIASNCARHVVVTLQPGITSTDQLRLVLAAVQALPNSFWWMRLHPTSLADEWQIAALMEAAAPGRFNIDRATSLPLYALLEGCDIHATHSSSTVIEAAAFDRPSVLWSRYGAELFASSIASGDAVAAFDAATFVEAIARLSIRRGQRPAESNHLAVALHQLMSD